MMMKDEVLAMCLSLEGAFARKPYGPQLLAMMVKETKAFCYIYEESAPLHIIVKCDPAEARLLREAYTAIEPGYHCNKEHWNSIRLDGSVPDGELRRMILNSYYLVLGRKAEVTPIQAL